MSGTANVLLVSMLACALIKHGLAIQHPGTGTCLQTMTEIIQYISELLGNPQVWKNLEVLQQKHKQDAAGKVSCEHSMHEIKATWVRVNNHSQTPGRRTRGRDDDATHATNGAKDSDDYSEHDAEVRRDCMSLQCTLTNIDPPARTRRNQRTCKSNYKTLSRVSVVPESDISSSHIPVD